MSRQPTPLFSVRESFLPLPENRLAMTAVEELSEPSPGRPGRLVFLSGPSGVGKSLLVRELVRKEHNKSKKGKWISLTASQFAAELAEASQEEALDKFSEKYRSLEVLICEDITALAGRRESQNQLAMTIDELLSTGGRVLISSTVPAGSLERFSRRLVNRFHGGVTASIGLPEFDSRVQLLNHFAAARQILLPHSIAELLADALPVSPRELLAALIQLETLARRQNTAITQALAEYYLNQETPPQPATLSEVAKAVARQFGVSLSGLRGKKRAHGVVLPRQCAMFLARELTDHSLLAIAQFFGRRHHSTVLHACKRMESAQDSEPALRQHLAQIRSRLGSHSTVNSCG
jgi:chromosomal replication initiator protein